MLVLQWKNRVRQIDLVAWVVVSHLLNRVRRPQAYRGLGWYSSIRGNCGVGARSIKGQVYTAALWSVLLQDSGTWSLRLDDI